MSGSGARSPRDRRIIVVGAGPAGASLALLLASRGIPITLLERQTDFRREFRGEVLLPAGIDVFRQMGLGSRFDELPQEHIHRIEIQSSHRLAFQFDLSDLGEEVGLFRIVSQPALLEMLVAEGKRYGTFEFVRGGLVHELSVEGPGDVSVSFRDGDEERVVRGALVVGADGRESLVRRRAGLHEARKPQTFDVVWCKLPRPAFLSESGSVRFHLGQHHFSVAFPSWDGRLQVGWIVEKGAFGRLRGQGIEGAVRTLCAGMPKELGSHIGEHLDEMSDPFLLDVVSDRLDRWTRPGVLLIGDAAHPMSPVGAQGINVALRDALAAANHLVPAYHGGDDQALELAARAIQRERAGEIAAIQRVQEVPPWLLMGRGGVQRLARRVIPSLLGSGLLTPIYRWGVSRLAHGFDPLELRV